MRYPPESDAISKNKRPIRHCEQREAIQTWLRIMRLSLNCFAVARNDDLPDSFILLTTPSGGLCNSYAKRIFPLSAPDEAKISLAKRKRFAGAPLTP
jgi:hypothetical protein